MFAAADGTGCGRARFDRCQQLRVQPQTTTVVGTDRRAVRAERCGAPYRHVHSRAFANDLLDLHAPTRQVTRLFLRHESL